MAREPRTYLLGAFDTDPYLAKSVVAAYGGVPLPNLDAVLEMRGVDIIFICTPNDHHADAVIAALGADKHVFCEKPVARSPREAFRVVEAAEHSSFSLKIGANTRHFAAVHKAYELLRKGMIGEVVFMRGSIGKSGRPASDWFSRRESAGGGSLLDNGSHLVDLIRWFAGEPMTCFGKVMTREKGLAVEDAGFGLIQLVGGQLATIQSSWIDWGPYLRVDVYGTDGMVTISHGSAAQELELHTRQGGSERFHTADDPLSSYGTELSYYINALDRGKSPRPNGIDALRVLEAIDALYTSARLGRGVSVANGWQSHKIGPTGRALNTESDSEEIP